MVRELVEQLHIPVLTQNYTHKNTPLHLASSRGHLDVVQFLVDQGAGLDLIDSEGGSALHYAAAGSRGEMNRDIIVYLVCKGADFCKLSQHGSSPLSAAVCAGNMPAIEYWEDHYAAIKVVPDPEKKREITERALKIAT